MSDFPVIKQPIMPVRHLIGGTYCYVPSYLFNFMRVSATRVEIDTYNLIDYLNRQQELLNDLQSAAVECEKIRAGRSNIGQNGAQFGYWFSTGYKYPLSNGKWHKENGSDNYLTVTTRDYTTEHWNYVGNTVYIKLEVHERLINELRANILNTIGRHIEQGISKAIEANTATVQQIQRERARLETQLKQLEVAEQKAIEREQAKAEKQSPHRDLSGYVYIIKQVNGTHYKIGHTANPDDRIRTFNVKLPFAVEFELLIKTHDRFVLEHELHAHFASKRVQGEWFMLDDSDLDYLYGIQQTIRKSADE